MKSKINFFHIKILVLIALMIVLALHKATANEEPVSIAITPFTLNAPEDMGYLQSGIQDMLESRLSQDKNITVISDEKTAQALEGIAEPIDENEARDIGQRLSADFVLIGSLTVFGSSTSLDARLVDVAGSQPTATFFEQSQKIDDLVPKVNTVAENISAKMMRPAIVAIETTPAAPKSEAIDDVNAHPEKTVDNMTASQATISTSPAAVLTGGPSSEFWKSRRFKILMNGIALGDVDGDGKIETIVITPDRVTIFRNESGKMFKIDEFEPGGFRTMIGVDVADINGNGFAEIFITAMNTQRNRIYSDVFEYDGNTFSRIVKNSPWKFRVIDVPRGNPLLLGQKHVANEPFSGAFFKLHWEAGEYQSGEQIGPGTGYNLMGFAYGDATNTGENSVVAYDVWNKMALIDSTGEVLWKHTEKTGGSTLQFSLGLIGQNEEGFQYLPMRILIKDTDKDGQNEVIAVKNYDSAKEALQNFRHFTDAEIHAFSWDGVGLSPQWNTKKISGYMRDFAIGDHDNDGRDELIVALVLKQGRIIGTTPRSVVIAYQF